MPINKVKGGYKWGTSGTTYPTRAAAVKQAQAAYASGYKDESTEQTPARKPKHIGLKWSK